MEVLKIFEDKFKQIIHNNIKSVLLENNDAEGRFIIIFFINDHMQTTCSVLIVLSLNITQIHTSRHKKRAPPTAPRPSLAPTAGPTSPP